MSSRTITEIASSRYANAIFELSLESKMIERMESELDLLADILDRNGDFRQVIRSAIFSRDEQIGVLRSVGKKFKLADLTVKALCLMASKRRLFVLKSVIEQFKKLTSDYRGEIKVSVLSATKLTSSQQGEIKTLFERQTKKLIILEVIEDVSLIGGIIVKIGSNIIDSSVKSQLGNLESKMKEVGL